MITATDAPPAWNRRLAAGLFLSSLALLALELVLVRIFSVLMWYHFVSLIVSLALLGMTASALAVFLAPRRFPPARVEAWLGRAALALSVAILADWAFLFAMSRLPRLAYQVLAPFHQPFYEPFGPAATEAFSGGTLAPLALIFAFSLLPFLCGGLVAALAVSRFSAGISRVYAADLAGAGSGCVATIALLTVLDPFRALAALAAVAAGAALLFLGRGGGRSARALAAAVLAGAAALAALGGGLVELKFVRGRYEPEILWTKWNSWSRLAVYPLRGGQAEGSWGMSRRFRGAVPEQLGMVVDDTGYSSMARFSPGADLSWARATLFALPYAGRPGADALVIGPGGGKELLVAHAMGSRFVRAVEINPLMVQAVQGPFGGFSGRPYSLPGVEAVIDDARTFLRRDPSRYDVIQATVVYGRLAPSAGAFTLTEDHLHTLEAFDEYLGHLKPDGVLAFSRFLFEKRILRMVATAREALARRGAADPSRHLFIASERGMATMLVKASPFDEPELRALEARCRELGFTVLAAPGRETGNPFGRLLAAPDAAAHYASLPYDVSPVTDDRPFFYYLVRPADFWRFVAGRAAPDFDDKALVLVRDLLALLAAALALLLFVPLARRAREDRALLAGAFGPLVYFACLGLGFVVAEIALLKRFILLLGKPVYSLAVILATFLAAGGLGSLGARGALGDAASLQRRCAAIAGLLLLQAAALPAVIEAALPLPIAARILVTVLAVAPAGYLMGQPFPLGIDLLRRRGEALIPWVWSVNGGLSVLGSMLTLVLAINLGYTATMLVAPGAYLVAMLAARKL